MKKELINLTVRFSFINKWFMGTLKKELEQEGINNVTPVQLLVIKNIGIDGQTIGSATNYGYYIGTNSNYNIKSLIKEGYVYKTKHPHDERSVILHLTEAGIELLDIIDCAFVTQDRLLLDAGLDAKDMKTTIKTIDKIEKLFKDHMG